MRRASVIITSLAVLATLTGVASAATSQPDPRADPVTVTAQKHNLPEVRAEAAVGPERVGTVEVVHRVLTYLTLGKSLVLTYPHASYVKPHLESLLLLPGDYLTVSTPDGSQSTRYESGSQWAMSVQGDTALVTLHGRHGVLSAVSGLGATVDKVAHGFTPTQQAVQERTDRDRRAQAVADPRAASGEDSRAESVCGSDDARDAVCYKSSDPVAYVRSKAVARLLINGDELCSAWRVGTHNRMFTNHHCFTSTADAHDTEVWFNYECAVCGGWATLRPTKVWADRVLATDQVLDYTLFTVENFTAVRKFGYLSLDVRDPAAGEELYIPEHPAGDPTVIATASDSDPAGNCQVDDPAADGYGTGTDVSYYCDTAGGSSGSPVISRKTNKVIALHHFGGCPNSGVRIDLIDRQVRQLL